MRSSRINEIKTDIEVIKNELKNINNTLSTIREDYEARLRIVESFKEKIVGIASFVSVISGMIGAFIGSFLKKIL